MNLIKIIQIIKRIKATCWRIRNLQNISFLENLYMSRNLDLFHYGYEYMCTVLFRTTTTSNLRKLDGTHTELWEELHLSILM